MKKVLGVFLALAMLGSLFAFVGCNSHEDLIKGDFSRAATAEQRSEVSQVLSAGDLWGDVSEEAWGVNVRQVVYGSVTSRASAQGESFNIDIDFNNVDHTISFRNEGGSIAFWGSGALDMKMDINASGMRMNTSMRGSIYNDMSRIYMDVNYTASASVNGQGARISDRMKVYDELTSGGDYGLDFNFSDEDVVSTLIDFSMVEQALADSGVGVYIDDSDPGLRKVKIEWDEDGFLQYFEDEVYSELESSAGASVSGDLVAGMDFGYCEYYFSIDKETGLLDGFGSKIKYDFGGSVTASGISVAVEANSNLTSWLMLTDTPAGDTPADLDSYSDIDSI